MVRRTPLIGLVALIGLCAFLWSASPAQASTVQFRSPLPNAVLQIDASRALLHIQATLSSDITGFSVRVLSDADPGIPIIDWRSLSITNSAVDTILRLPVAHANYTLEWQASAFDVTNGTVIGMTPGHVIGIAGQSNAVGFCWDMRVARQGDIRMLKSDNGWEPASEPTSDGGGGPWIVMANMLWKQLGDGYPIGIINTAVGGTGLTQDGPSGRWQRNSAQPEDSSIYGRALRRFRQAGSRLECLCWIQGESDGEKLPEPDIYRWTFSALMQNLYQDLGDTFHIFHSQIAGNSRPYASPASLPKVREALRALPLSTLVGTAIGRSILDDGLHYTVPTYTAIGKMFAGAILSEIYGKPSSVYPPVTPDTSAVLDSAADGSVPGRYFLRLHWNHGLDQSVKLQLVHSAQYFAIGSGFMWYDTSQVWSKVSERDPSVVEIGLRYDSINPKRTYTLSYVPTAGTDYAPLASIDGMTLDTTFAVAFDGLPVTLPGQKPLLSVHELYVHPLVPNPAGENLRLYIESPHDQAVTITIYNVRGEELLARRELLTAGENEIDLPVISLPSGSYWAIVRSENEQVVKRAVVFR